MSTRLRETLFITTISSCVLFKFQYNETYAVILSNILFFINPYYILIPFLFCFNKSISFISAYAIYTLLLLLCKHFKNKKIKEILPFILSSSLFLFMSIVNKDFNNLIISMSVLFLLYLLIGNFVLKNDLVDYKIYRPILLLIACIAITFSKSYMHILLIGSIITFDIEIIFISFLTIISYKFGIEFAILIVLISSIIFIKNPYLKSLIYFFIGIFLIRYSYFYLIPVGISIFNALIPEFKPYVIPSPTTNFNSYLTSMAKTIKDLNYYEDVEKRIIDILKNYCVSCKHKKECANKGKLSLYQFLMYLSVDNIKENDNIRYYLNKCPNQNMIRELPKIDFFPYFDVRNININVDLTNINNPYFIKVLNILNKYKYSILEANDTSINSLCFTIKLKNKYSFDLLKHRLKKELPNDIVIENDKNTLKIYNKPKFKILYDSIVLAKKNIYISGDNVLFKQTDFDYYMALSDGMGSGLRAYEASKAMLMRLEALLNLNISDNLVLDNLKQICSYSTYHDTYGTLDLIHINKTSYKCNLYKVASACSFLVRGNHVFEFETDTLPLGADLEITKHEIELEDYDVILIVSDGVTDFVNRNELLFFMKEISIKTPDKIASELSQFIFEKQKNSLNDDASIIVIKILPFTS